MAKYCFYSKHFTKCIQGIKSLENQNKSIKPQILLLFFATDTNQLYYIPWTFAICLYSEESQVSGIFKNGTNDSVPSLILFVFFFNVFLTSIQINEKTS